MIPLKSTIYILGSGGFANEVATYIRELVTTSSNQSMSMLRGRTGMLPDHLQADVDIHYVDDHAAGEGILTVRGYQNAYSTFSTKPKYSIMGSGQCSIKLKMKKEIIEPYFSMRHPRSTISGSSQIGNGSVTAPGAVIAARTILGEHVLVNYNATIGHDTKIGSFSVVSPNAAVGGFCDIGEAVYIGSGAQIKEKITIGDGAIIGMGAIVTKDVPPGVTIVKVNERLN